MSAMREVRRLALVRAQQKRRAKEKIMANDPSWPECMAPDGGEACAAFVRIADERLAWRQQAEKAEERYTKVVLETNWRTIDTAPKDGTKILLAKIVGHPSHETALWWAARGFWSNKWNNWNDGVEPSGFAGPTHWLPVNGYGIPLSSLYGDP